MQSGGGIMMVTINIPDTLPQKRVWQRIREIEESLKEEARFFQSIIKEKDLSDNDNELFWKSFGSWEGEKIIPASSFEQPRQWPDFVKRAKSIFGKNPPGKNVSNYLKEAREDRFSLTARCE